MKFSKFVATLALASGTALAAPPYDGIYRVAQGEWLTVLERNGTVIVAYYFSSNSNNVVAYPLVNGQRYVPPRLDNWDLLSGPVSNGIATLTGESIYGACKLTAQINFSIPAFRLSYIEPTASGYSQGINCGAVADWLIFNHGNVNLWPIVKIW